MKMKKWSIAAIAVALVGALGMFGCSGSQEQQPAADTDASYELLNDGELTVILSPDYPPFENLENGELEGFEVDLFKAVADQMGLTYAPVYMQFDAIIPAIAAGGQGDVGVSGFSVDPERAKTIDFTEMFYIDDQAVAVMDDSSITEENAATALNSSDVIIAVQTGTTGADYAAENFPNATIQGYGSSNDCFAAMQSGQATAVCTNLAVVAQMLKTGYPDAHVVLQAATGEEYAAVVSQDNPGLTQALNDALQVLQDNGTIDELKQKWFATA